VFQYCLFSTYNIARYALTAEFHPHPILIDGALGLTHCFARVRISRSRSPKVIDSVTSRKSVYDFLLVSHSNNFGSILPPAWRALWLFTAAVAAHPNKTAPLLWACGTDGRLAWPIQGLTCVNSRATQGLEAPPRTSASHLAWDLESRPSDAQSWPELSMATRPGQRTL